MSTDPLLRPGLREARVRREAAASCPWAPHDLWLPAGALADMACATATTPQRPADARSPTTRSSFAAAAPRRCSTTGLEPAGPIIPPRFQQPVPVSAGERRGAHRLPGGQASSERRREVSRRLPGRRMDSGCDGGRVRAGSSGDRAGSSGCPRPPPARRRHVGVPWRRTLEANSAASAAPDRRPRPSRRQRAPFPPGPESGSQVV